MEGQGLEALRARLEQVERRLRFAAVAWVASVLVAILLGVAAQQAVSQPEVLRARRIEVVDAAGRTRISLGTAPDGTSWLGLQDAAGEIRAGLAVFPDGSPRLTLWDAAERVLFRAP